MLLRQGRRPRFCRGRGFRFRRGGRVFAWLARHRRPTLQRRFCLANAAALAFAAAAAVFLRQLKIILRTAFRRLALTPQFGGPRPRFLRRLSLRRLEVAFGRAACRGCFPLSSQFRRLRTRFLGCLPLRRLKVVPCRRTRRSGLALSPQLGRLRTRFLGCSFFANARSSADAGSVASPFVVSIWLPFEFGAFSNCAFRRLTWPVHLPVTWPVHLPA
ncbi:hypothetical protein DI43_18305 [Geobacillus sp. CAMR12739]|nr:hypothetical protein DI43_18305 [Geobacillus sp. CAMR12739]